MKASASRLGKSFSLEYADIFRPIPAKLENLVVAPLPTATKNLSPNVRRVVLFVHEKLLREGLTVKTVKALCNIGNNNISTQFKREVGITIKDYIEGLRMHIAARLLRDNSLSISEISYQLGYTHVQTFYRVFRRQYGSPPRRKEVCGAPEIECGQIHRSEPAALDKHTAPFSSLKSAESRAPVQKTRIVIEKRNG